MVNKAVFVSFSTSYLAVCRTIDISDGAARWPLHILVTRALRLPPWEESVERLLHAVLRHQSQHVI